MNLAPHPNPENFPAEEISAASSADTISPPRRLEETHPNQIQRASGEHQIRHKNGS